MQIDVLDKLLHADHIAKNAKTERKMRKRLRQSPTITVNGQRLQVADKFTYLGSAFSKAVYIDDEVRVRIAKVSIAFGRLRGNVTERNGIRLGSKLNVYIVLVLPTLLSWTKTSTAYQSHAKRLYDFNLFCLRKLMIKWQDKIPDTDNLKKAGMQSVHTI